jgi:putative CocE/NonD family hydrolase
MKEPDSDTEVVRTTTEYDVPIPMRDGTILRSRVVRPELRGRVPVVLVRSPYPLEVSRFEFDESAATRRGLAVVLVSHRGTGASDGDFDPWNDDAADGVDLIEWCASQGWSSGEVVTLGRSYVAGTQLYAAGAKHPALRAMALGVCPSDPYDIQHVGGACTLAASLGWAFAQAGGLISRRIARGEAEPSEMAEWMRLMDDFVQILRHGPLPDIPLLDRAFPGWRSGFEHPARDGWWGVRALPEREPMPAFYVGGWHDIFIRGTLHEFTRARHPDSQLVVGPWGHSQPAASLGEVQFGPRASGAAVGIDDRMLDCVSLFVMGENAWHRTSAWPPPESMDQELFLLSGSRLAADGPGIEGELVQFLHDPSDPVPTLGGNNLFLDGDAGRIAGSWDQRDLDGRSDILNFVSEPLPHDLDVIGVVRLSLVASTSAVDTDWCAKLVDVHPNGRALNVVDGVVRARLSDSDSEERPLEPGVPHRFEIEVGPTAQRFVAGHRIRLDIASSNHPRFDVNPGNGGTWAGTRPEDYVRSVQTVYLDHDHASFLTLPVVDCWSEG